MSRSSIFMTFHGFLLGVNTQLRDTRAHSHVCLRYDAREARVPATHITGTIQRGHDTRKSRFSVQNFEKRVVEISLIPTEIITATGISQDIAVEVKEKRVRRKSAHLFLSSPVRHHPREEKAAFLGRRREQATPPKRETAGPHKREECSTQRETAPPQKKGTTTPLTRGEDGMQRLS